MSSKAKSQNKAKPTPKKTTKSTVKKTPVPKPKASLPEEKETSSSSSSSDESAAPQRVGNRFALLDDEDNDKVTTEEETSAKETGNDSEQVTENTVEHAKKKTKRKKKTSLSFAASHDKSAPILKDWKDMTDDQIMESFAALNVNTNSSEAVDGEEKKDYSASSFSVINPKLLNYRYEFQKTVGKSGMSALLPDAAPAAKSSRGLSKGIQHLFVTPQPNTQDPKIFMDRFMSLDRESAKSPNLVFKRLKKYKELQRDFLMMVHSSQDQVIQEVLHQMPYHTDALLLMCSIYERDDNYSSARQTIENALMSLQSCFDHHQRNNPHLHRFSYVYPANRSYFVTLFKHILLSTSRFPLTALETAKYLFNLNPKEDPLAVILMIDYLVLKAKDYSYIQAFYDVLKDQKQLEMLPNYAFSVPLSTYLHTLQSSSDVDVPDGLEKASQALKEALLRFPNMLWLLSGKLNFPVDREVSSSALFSRVRSESNDGLDMLQELYVRRCSDFWKEPSVVEWLCETAKSVAAESVTSAEMQFRINLYSNNRKKLYRGTPSSIWRHIILLNIPDSERIFNLRLLTESQSFIFPFDPIPPKNSEERDEWDLRVHLSPDETRRRPAATAPTVVVPEGEAGAGDVVQRVVQATGLFFRMLFPSTAVQAAAAEQDPLSALGGDIVMGAAISEQDENGDELRASLESVAARANRKL